jgi:hypothetical protein
MFERKRLALFSGDIGMGLVSQVKPAVARVVPADGTQGL